MKKLLARAVSVVEHLRIWLLGQHWFASALLPALPRRVRWMLRKVYLAPVDLADRLLGRRDESLPPKASTFTGGVRDFAQSGEMLLQALRDVAGLTPSSHVVDVGCGIGRLAIPMASFLGHDGFYEGFDVVPEGIAWCTENISSRHGNVHFTVADVYNKEYHPEGAMQASEYTFPYDDDTFDIAVLVSVFTHMLPGDLDRYVGEIARVLKPEGRCFVTYFLLTRDDPMVSAAGQRRFRHDRGTYSVTSARVPELAVAYEERYVRELYAKHGLSDEPAVYRGGWSGGTAYWALDSELGDQDTFVATKLAEPRLQPAAAGGRGATRSGTTEPG
jgi:SAM-dependent methyltransferase